MLVPTATDKVRLEMLSSCKVKLKLCPILNMRMVCTLSERYHFGPQLCEVEWPNRSLATVFTSYLFASYPFTAGLIDRK